MPLFGSHRRLTVASATADEADEGEGAGQSHGTLLATGGSLKPPAWVAALDRCPVHHRAEAPAEAVERGAGMERPGRGTVTDVARAGEWS